MVARHLLWHVGVAAVAVAVLAAFGVPLASALPIGLMAGCVAMVFHGGHGSHGRPEPHGRPAEKAELDERTPPARRT